MIISSDTGGGHSSAAAAIVAGGQRFAQERSPEFKVIRAIEESETRSVVLVRLYNWMLRYRQHWIKYLYWSINSFRPETKELFYAHTVAYVCELFKKWRFDAIVSVHPMTQHASACVLRRLGLTEKIPLVTVVTDPYYGFWKGWACSHVTLYLVGSEEARQQLIEYGVAAERIKVSGIPLHPKFESVDAQAAREARLALGLDPQKFTILANAGWAGGGNIFKIFCELVHADLDVQVIFLAGRNEALEAKAKELAAEAKFPVRVVGFTDKVEQLMMAADVMISKLGGLTTFEALSCGLPIIGDATTPLMPQEISTAKRITLCEAGILLKHVTEVVPVVRALAESASRRNDMRAAAAALVIPDAAERVVEEVLASINVMRSPG
ncbi:MAG TPA: glycosyltransferase [Pyrinomonadaceae bacterium]|nr:glycosyltransferase [Pyrinomonadaceae bacterium]